MPFGGLGGKKAFICYASYVLGCGVGAFLTNVEVPIYGPLLSSFGAAAVGTAIGFGAGSLLIGTLFTALASPIAAASYSDWYETTHLSVQYNQEIVRDKLVHKINFRINF